MRPWKAERSAGLLRTGSGIETTVALNRQDSTSAARLAAANAIDCGSAAYTCSACAGFIDSCGPCVFDFAAFRWGVWRRGVPRVPENSVLTGKKTAVLANEARNAGGRCSKMHRPP